MSTAMIAETKVRKWGRSLGITLPKQLCEDAHITAGMLLKPKLNGSQLIFELAPKVEDLTLEELLMLVNSDQPENRGHLEDMGDYVGREVF